MKCYLGVGHEREEVASIDVGGYFGESALLHDLPIKVPCCVSFNRCIIYLLCPFVKDLGYLLGWLVKGTWCFRLLQVTCCVCSLKVQATCCVRSLKVQVTCCVRSLKIQHTCCVRPLKVQITWCVRSLKV